MSDAGRQLRQLRPDRQPHLSSREHGATDSPAARFPKGKWATTTSTEEAAEHARLTRADILAILKEELGDLDRVRRIVKLLGMVNCTPDFQEQSYVINGCSDLFVQVFGEGHARSAVGMGSLPFGITVEIEAIVEVD